MKMMIDPAANRRRHQRHHHHRHRHQRATSNLISLSLLFLILHVGSFLNTPWKTPNVDNDVFVLGFSITTTMIPSLQTSAAGSGVASGSSSISAVNGNNNKSTNHIVVKTRRAVLLETGAVVAAASASSSSSSSSANLLLGTTASSVSALAVFPLTCAAQAYIDPSTDMPKITSRVYLDVQIGGDDKTEKETDDSRGRIVIGLFGQEMPRTASNFERLCRDNAYAGTTFYRVISNVTIQGGAIGQDSKSGKSSSSPTPPFEPDNYNIQHSVAGLVSMVRRGVGNGTADSRFFIQTSADATGWADDRYAAFGIVMPDDNGLDFVKQRIQTVPVQPPQNRPIVDVKIVASGVL
jgi:peptidyl-prolyl cis-trans isomerase B (cyclophilin B)